MFIIVYYFVFYPSHTLFLTLSHSVESFCSIISFSSIRAQKSFYFTFITALLAQTFRFVATAKMVESGWKANYLLICEVAFQILVIVVVVFVFCIFFNARQTHNKFIPVVSKFLIKIPKVQVHFV